MCSLKTTEAKNTTMPKKSTKRLTQRKGTDFRGNKTSVRGASATADRKSKTKQNTSAGN